MRTPRLGGLGRAIGGPSEEQRQPRVLHHRPWAVGRGARARLRRRRTFRGGGGGRSTRSRVSRFAMAMTPPRWVCCSDRRLACGPVRGTLTWFVAVVGLYAGPGGRTPGERVASHVQ